MENRKEKDKKYWYDQPETPYNPFLGRWISEREKKGMRRITRNIIHEHISKK